MINDYISFEAECSELEGLILNKPIAISNYEWYRDIIQCIHTAHNSVNTQSIQNSICLPTLWNILLYSLEMIF